MKDFKSKYHGDAYRSKLFATFERIAREQLEAIIAAARLPLEVRPLGVGVGRSGIVEGFSSTGNRFDFAIVRPCDRAVVCLVEVTGDFINDNLARILIEKLEKIEHLVLSKKIPVYIMYQKRTRTGTVKKTKFFDAPTLLTAYRFGCDSQEMCYLDLWKEDEKPYLFINLRYAFDARSMRSRLRNLVKGIGKEIPLIKLEELLR